MRWLAIGILCGCGSASGMPALEDAGVGDAALDAGLPDATSAEDAPIDAGAMTDAAATETDASRDAGDRVCTMLPPCDAPLPDLGATEAWRHPIATALTVAQGTARHRGRDLILTPESAQWALAKLAYGPLDDDLKDEDVDLYLLRGCAGAWEHLGTATTTDDLTRHATVEGVADDGGRLYFEIPAAMRLGPGRHRIRFVVRGDHSGTDQILHVLDGTERWVVSDVDGTLTESENAEFLTLLSGPSPAANPSAPEALTALARRGYRILYLTARPDWLGARTYEWLPERGFPPGVIHTTLSDLGALGSAAVTFKTAELEELEARTGSPPDIAIGNTDTDAEAYAAVGVPARYLYQLDADAMGGTVFSDYAELVAPFDALPAVCP